MSNALAILRSGGRAVTAEDKRETVERLLKAWLAVPEQRFAQFLVNAATARSKCPLFYAEDGAVCDAAEVYARDCGRMAK